MKIKYTETELLNNLIDVMNKVGHYPSYEDARKYGNISPKTIRSRLGPNWSDVKRKLGWIPTNEMPHQEISDLDAGWLAGIIDGEGCFRMQTPSPSNVSSGCRAFAPVFCMSLRTDDKSALDELVRIIGDPYVAFHIDNRNESVNANPVYKIFIRDLPTLVYFLLPAMERCGLRTKKKYELVVFKFACQILLDKRLTRRVHAYTDEERSLLWSCYYALSEMKVYNSDKQAILVKYNLDKVISLPV